ncbi:hypothetical protein FHP25_24070 [Vineibacter terrae]|uniref:DUF1795 domain-containing protein n=1 Tax=Vineibacter terrae TaxID=2586908 RepID=A0A5C8PGU6_9HYPH|nr:hypothetical protein [Vineibacter terrae]TXL72845.1 hypothetical protein FHP25_24070 [Vineibacter terrae]
MRRIALCLLLLLVALPAAAQQTELYDGGVSLQLPADFRPMTRDEITRKYPRSQPPQFAFTDGDGLTQTIAVSRWQFSPGSPPPLSDLGADMYRRVAVQSGITMRRNGLVEIGARQWYALEFTVQAVDQPIENLMRITTINNYIVILAASVTSKLYPEREEALRTAIESATVR